MLAVFAFAVFFYTAAVLVMWLGWLVTKAPEGPPPQKPVTVTVVVPFRNEAEHVGQLVDDLARQQDWQQGWHVVLVDDHSTDASRQVVQQRLDSLQRPEFRLLTLEDGTEGKKQAIWAAVQASHTQYIMTTDADCRLPERWVASMVQHIQQRQVSLVAAPVAWQVKGWAQEFVRIEMMALQIVTGGSFLWGVPAMANGANLIYHRGDFMKAKPYAGNWSVPSGDDSFLLHALHRQKRPMRFFKASHATVTSQLPTSLAQWYHQRIRWASKWRHTGSVAWAVGVFVLMLAYLVGSVAAILQGQWMWWSAGFCGLVLVQAVSFFTISAEMHWRRPNFVAIALFALTYPVYALAFGLLSLRSGYRWKGRSVRK